MPDTEITRAETGERARLLRVVADCAYTSSGTGMHRVDSADAAGLPRIVRGHRDAERALGARTLLKVGD